MTTESYGCMVPRMITESLAPKRLVTRRPSLNLTGERYGELIVLQEAPRAGTGKRRWRVLCDCGQEDIAQQAGLRIGSKTSCSDCTYKRRLERFATVKVGDRFGKLVVTARNLDRKGRGQRWLTACDCGGVRVCNSSQLNDGQAIHCVGHKFTGAEMSQRARHMQEARERRRFDWSKTPLQLFNKPMGNLPSPHSLSLNESPVWC
jgi:hypothetical protein